MRFLHYYCNITGYMNNELRDNDVVYAKRRCDDVARAIMRLDELYRLRISDNANDDVRNYVTMTFNGYVLSGDVDRAASEIAYAFRCAQIESDDEITSLFTTLMTHE